MSAGFTNGSAEAERLCALVDGETDGAASDAACAGWKADAEVRRTWHAWQLIGDVMRSEDLASTAARDQRFMFDLRARLAVEPVVLAPAALLSVAEATGPRVGARRSANRWMLPSAIAAGFMLVVGTFAVVRPGSGPESPAAAVVLAGNGTEVASPLREVTMRESAAARSTVVANGKLIRDARLDRYLAAHKQFAGTSALGVPSAFLRSATVDAEPR